MHTHTSKGRVVTPTTVALTSWKDLYHYGDACRWSKIMSDDSRWNHVMLLSHSNITYACAICRVPWYFTEKGSRIWVRVSMILIIKEISLWVTFSLVKWRVTSTCLLLAGKSDAVLGNTLVSSSRSPPPTLKTIFKGLKCPQNVNLILKTNHKP